MPSTDASDAGGGRAPDPIEALQERLGHRFDDPDLLLQALTHGSLNQPGASSYERLEFLGDRVLGLVMADWLWHRFAGDVVGLLARRFAVLVDQATLARVARRLGIASALRMARSEKEAGADLNPSVLADACEAVIAAVYLDGGLERARAVIQRHWRDEVDAEVTASKDPKTALQEWAQGQGLALPLYREIERDGPAHAPRFLIEVAVEGVAPRRAHGTTKRQAERAAATAMLAAILDGSAPEAEGTP